MVLAGKASVFGLYSMFIVSCQRISERKAIAYKLYNLAIVNNHSI